MSVDQFISMNFINRKIQQYRANMNSKDLKNMFNLFSQNELANNQKNEKLLVNQLSKQTNFRKVTQQFQFLGYDQDYCMIFGIYGMKIQKANKNYLIAILQKIIEENCFHGNESINAKKQNHSENKKNKTPGVTLIFFNSHGRKRHKIEYGRKISQPIKIDNFKDEIIKCLRFKHLSRINHIVILHTSFFNRSWGYLSFFGFKDGFYGKFITFFESISEALPFLGPLFEYEKIRSDFLMEEQVERIKSMAYSNQQIIQSKQQFTFYQQFESPLNNETKSFFAYHSQIRDYRKDPHNGIPLLLSNCFKYLLEEHIKFQGLFRKVSDQEDLRKLQNMLLRMESDEQFNEKSQQLTSVEQIIKDELKKFSPQTITSFAKKLFTSLQNPLLSHYVYESITQLSWMQLQNVLECMQQNQIKKNQKFTQMNFMEMQQCVQTSVTQQKVDVKEKIAFFENLSLQKTNSLFSQSSFITSTSKVDNNNSRKQNKIPFTKLTNPNQFSKNSQQKLKNNDFIMLKEMQNNSTEQFLLLRETIFFLNKVASERKFNLMSAKNLAVCFNPCFFRILPLSKRENSCSVQQELQNQSKLVHVIQKMIEHPENFFVTN